VGPVGTGMTAARRSPGRPLPPGNGAASQASIVDARAAARIARTLQQELVLEFPAGFVAIWHAVARLAPGTVASYGEIARRAGLPGRARLVARALGRAPAQLRLPWHRVLRAEGRIAFAPGSHDFNRQRRQLEREGVPVSDSGRVRITALSGRAGEPGDPDDSLDASLWRLPPA